MNETSEKAKEVVWKYKEMQERYTKQTKKRNDNIRIGVII